MADQETTDSSADDSRKQSFLQRVTVPQAILIAAVILVIAAAAITFLVTREDACQKFRTAVDELVEERSEKEAANWLTGDPPEDALYYLREADRDILWEKGEVEYQGETVEKPDGCTQ